MIEAQKAIRDLAGTSGSLAERLYQAIERFRRLAGGKARKAEEDHQRTKAGPTTNIHD